MLVEIYINPYHILFIIMLNYEFCICLHVMFCKSFCFPLIFLVSVNVQVYSLLFSYQLSLLLFIQLLTAGTRKMLVICSHTTLTLFSKVQISLASSTLVCVLRIGWLFKSLIQRLAAFLLRWLHWMAFLTASCYPESMLDVILFRHNEIICCTNLHSVIHIFKFAHC